MKRDLESARNDFETLSNTAFLSSSAVSPLPRQTIEAMGDAMQKMRVAFDEKFLSETHVEKDCKKAISKIIGSATEEVSLTHSTTEGICAFAESLDWKRGDEIVINDLEYPSNVMPWFGVAKRHGARVRIVRNVSGEVRAEDIEKAVGKRTRVISISHVEFSNGFRCDLPAISEVARNHGAYLFVDAIQSVGAIGVDVARMGIDALACGGYKWMCGPSGTGFLFVKNDVAQKLLPAYIGFHSIADREQKDIWRNLVVGNPFVKNFKTLKKGGGRFDYAYTDPVAFSGLVTSSEYLLSLGIGRIERKIRHLVSRLEEMVSHTEIITPKRRAGILSFRPSRFTKSMSKAFEKRCKERNISITIRQGAIRAACHFFNNEEDLERLAEVVGEF